MNKRRYSNRRRKNILRVFILLMTIIITVVMWRTIKIDVQVGELTLPKILQSEKSFADTSILLTFGVVIRTKIDAR